MPSCVRSFVGDGVVRRLIVGFGGLGYTSAGGGR